MLRCLRHENGLSLSLYEGCLRLRQHVVLTWYTTGHHILQLPTRALL